MGNSTQHPPVALCTATRSKRDGVWHIVVHKCPHCGKRHKHGGNDGDTPSLGHRVADCENGVPNKSYGYYLALAEPQ